MTLAVDLDNLMRQGWPAHTEVPVDGWIARLSAGVTQRANSVVPLAAPTDLTAAIDRVEQLYREHGIAPSFQIGPAVQPANLDEVLAERGYRYGSHTSIEVVPVDELLTALADVETGESRISGKPEPDWMELWWSVDGRGDEQAKADAYRIMTGGPAAYAVRRDEHGSSAVGRMAFVGEWAGLYCLAVRPDRRRQGQAASIIRALTESARDQGARHIWLQVLADNHGARALYSRLGFRTAGWYHYWRLTSGQV
ncbi:MAG TPA: GNAT family N-acetyltransferase [Pseudonocardiaceae bacterium]|jgi:ribosomal protein S18 acetylase RimI-like enzyme|nr:GNAT family N-acetyltransferase [Pseudonocardiaceae bacterium]